MTGRRADSHYRRARAEGYRARSAYKLAELDRRFGLVRPGDFVIDLGAGPGGWLQVTLERVGPRGRVVGVDVARIQPLAAPNVSLLQLDVREPVARQAVRDHLGRPADVVLSDLSPKLTGVRATDEARSAELVSATLDALGILLRPGGRLLMKLFMDAQYQVFLARLQGKFAEVRSTRAGATRKGSAELYVVGLGYRGAPQAG